MFKSLIILFILLFSNLIYSQENFNKSYGELAKDTIQTGLDRVLAETSVLIHSTPPVNTKKLRIEIGNLKLLIDVFSFAYPRLKKGNHKFIDPLIDFREVLNEGYEIVGKFKDLSDSGTLSGSLPPTEELAKLRFKAISWKNKFLEHIQENDTRFYLTTPIVNGFQNREIESLHKYTWKQINFRPNTGLDGLTIIKRMCSEVLIKSNSHLNSMLSFNDLFDLEREELFHSVRKEVRIVLKMAQMVPGVFSSEINQGTENKTAALAVDKFGSIHDLLMAFQRAKDKKNKPKVKELKSRLFIEFKNLKNWVYESDLNSKLDSLARQLQ